jgi:hypothetical protein
VLTVNHLRTIGASQADAAGLLGSGCALKQLTAGASLSAKSIALEVGHVGAVRFCVL